MRYEFRHWYIPDRMMTPIRLYIKHGVHPGSFLTAVISNDFREAVGHADDENLNNLPAYMDYFYNHAPCSCWGSPEIMNAWMARFPERVQA